MAMNPIMISERDRTMKVLNVYGISRRKFLKGGLCALGGFVALDAGLFFRNAAAATPTAGEWPYVVLDPVSIGQSAWDTPGCKGCGGQSLGAIASGLKSALGPGSPWDELPVNIGAFGNGGGPQRQTCGALIGPYLVMSLVGADKALGKKFYQWYCDATFPSKDWDDYVPKSETKPLKTITQTISKSTLCSVSRDTWEKEYLRLNEGKDVKGPSKDRCTKLICDCTRKAVELLNAWKSGEIQEDAGQRPKTDHPKT
jgi:hypothetical protein